MAKSGGDGVRGNEVNDALTVETNGGEGLDATEATGPSGRQNYEYWTVHDHRTTALAHVIPPPNPVMSAIFPVSS